MDEDWIKRRSWDLPQPWDRFYRTMGNSPEQLSEFMTLDAAYAMPLPMLRAAYDVLKEAAAPIPAWVKPSLDAEEEDGERRYALAPKVWR